MFRPKVFDCFTYNGELDLLRLRMEVLKDVVDYFVIAEADRSFTGESKRMTFDANLFSDYSDKLIYIPVCDLDPRPTSAWTNEFRQRDCLMSGIAPLARADDFIVLSDVDEIPRPESIALYQPQIYLSALLSQRNHYYAFNNLAVDQFGLPKWWRRVRVTTFENLTSWFGGMQSLRDFKPRGLSRSFRKYWNKRRTQIIEEAGWHFSYLMTAEAILEKLKSFSHQEVNVPSIANFDHIRDCISSGVDLFGVERFKVVPLNYFYPPALISNKIAYSRYIFDV